MRRISFLSILLLYFSSGLSLTLYNKFIVSASHYGFTYPVTLILVHMVTNCALSWVALRCVFHAQTRHSPFHPRNITRGVFLRQFVPIGLLFGADIVLTNVSFRFVSVSLTEVVKSSVPALIFLLGLLRGQDRSRTWWLLAAKLLNVVLICLGVAFTAAGEVDFEIRGFIAALGATAAATIKLILIEVLLARVEQDVPGPPGMEPGGARNSGGIGSGGLHAAENGVGSALQKSHLSPVSPSANGSGSGNGLNHARSNGLNRPHLSVTDDEPAFPHQRSASNTPHADGGAGSGNPNGSGRAFSLNGSTSASTKNSKQSYARLDAADDDASEHEQSRLTPTARNKQQLLAGDHEHAHAHVSHSSSGTPRGGGVHIERVHVGSGASAGDLLHSSPLGSSPNCDDSAAPELAPHGSAVGPHAHRLHPILSLFYFTPVSALALLPLQLWLEFPSLTHSKFVSAGIWEVTVAIILFGALMAFGLNCSELFVISETSALTLCIFGVLKFLMIVTLSWLLFAQRFTAVNQVGIAITIVSLIVYNSVKWYEAREREREIQAPQMNLGGSPTFQGSHGIGRATGGGSNTGGGGSRASPEALQLHHATLMALESGNGGGVPSSPPRTVPRSAPASDSEGSSGSSNCSSNCSEDSLLPRSVVGSASSSLHKPRMSPPPLLDADGGAGSLVQDIGSRLLHAFAAADRLDDPDDDPDDDDQPSAVAHVRPTSPGRAILQ